MSIFVDKTTRVLVQGITGNEGQFHTRHCIDYGTQVVAGVTPGKGGQNMDDVPVFNTVQEAKDNIPAVSLTPVSYVATTGIDEFKPKVIYMTIDEAWEGNFGKDKKKPW